MNNLMKKPTQTEQYSCWTGKLCSWKYPL